MTSSTPPSKKASTFSSDDAKPRFRGAWSPALHDPSPVTWSFEVRNASNVLNGLTDNIRIRPTSPPPKASASSSVSSSVPSAKANETSMDKLSIDENKKKESALPAVRESDTGADGTTAASDEGAAASSALQPKAGDAKLEETKVEEHNKSITQLATTLVEYEMTHGEVEAANKRVADIINKYKGVISEDEIVAHIIKSKCIQAALVGLIIGGCATIPGLGSIAAIIIGAAADGALTTKLQVDMMLEIGCALGHYQQLKDNKYRKECLLLSAGLIKKGVDAEGKDIFVDSATNDPFTTEAGHRVSEKALEEFGKRSFLYFIPVVGAVTAAATDLSWTYVIGKRSEILFRKGESELPAWSESVKTHTGVDSTSLSSWLIEAFELPRKRIMERMRTVSSSVMTTLRKYTSSSAASASSPSTPPS